MSAIRGRWVLARKDDPSTSHAAAAKVLEREGSGMVVRKNSQRHKILWAFSFGPNTDNGAADIARIISNCRHRRAGDLRNMGYIELTGTTLMDPDTGAACRVSQITEAGLRRLEELGVPQ